MLFENEKNAKHLEHKVCTRIQHDDLERKLVVGNSEVNYHAIEQLVWTNIQTR